MHVLLQTHIVWLTVLICFKMFLMSTLKKMLGLAKRLLLWQRYKSGWADRVKC